MRELSLEWASTWFCYDADTGLLMWKQSPGSRIAVGSPITSLNASGYVKVVVQGRAYPAHRIAWLLTHGECPTTGVIDHVNGVRDDNRLANLRLVSHRANSHNSRRTRSGALVGAYQVTPTRWKSSICIKGQYVLLGMFASAEEAHARYNAACAVVDQFVNPAQFKALAAACDKQSSA